MRRNRKKWEAQYVTKLLGCAMEDSANDESNKSGFRLSRIICGWKILHDVLFGYARYVNRRDVWNKNRGKNLILSMHDGLQPAI